MVDPESQPDSGKVAAIGSCMILEAETLADAKELVESDIYYTSGVVSFYLRDFWREYADVQVTSGIPRSLLSYRLFLQRCHERNSCNMCRENTICIMPKK